MLLEVTAASGDIQELTNECRISIAALDDFQMSLWWETTPVVDVAPAAAPPAPMLAPPVELDAALDSIWPEQLSATPSKNGMPKEVLSVMRSAKQTSYQAVPVRNAR
jgi:hypothetical protein